MTLRSHRRGVTLLELIIAMAVLAIALLALVSSITSSAKVQQNTRDKTLAYNAAREVIEQMRAYPIDEIWRRYNSATGDNVGTGSNPGNTFTVARLNAPPSGVPVGQVFFPEKGGALNETYVDPSMGMPKDLNRNGDALDTNVNDTYRILPVKVVVTWMAIGGREIQIEVNTLITEK